MTKNVFSAWRKEDAMGFKITDETFKTFTKLNTQGRILLIQSNPAHETSDRSVHVEAKIKSLSDHLFQNIPDRDLVGLTIRNTENMADKPGGIAFRRRDQIQSDFIWSVLRKVIQSNARNAIAYICKCRDHTSFPSGHGGGIATRKTVEYSELYKTGNSGSEDGDGRSSPSARTRRRNG
jgi:hypothetical protein